MPVHSSAVGKVLDVHHVDMTARKALAYAARIDDTSTYVFDDAREGGIIAPPQFCVSLEWPVVSGDLAYEAFQIEAAEKVRGVHVTKDSIFHKPIRPGMKLKTIGTVTGVRQARAGAHNTIKLQTIERDSGEVLVTSWTTRIIRDVDIVGGEISNEAVPRLPEASGIEQASDRILIARQMPHIYSECADIWNPIHTERAVALAAGLPDIILHGTATWALVGREVVRAQCGGNPGQLKRLFSRFSAVVIPGQEIKISLDEPKDSVIGFTVLNHLGQKAVSDGIAVVE